MNFKIKLNRNGGIAKEELLEDLIKVSKTLNKKSITMDEYESIGNFSRGAFKSKKKFGSWNNALEQAGLSIVKRGNNTISKEDCFNNLIKVWLNIGKQPSQTDLNNKEISSIVSGTYKRIFDNKYNNALKEFESFINNPKSNLPMNKMSIKTDQLKHTTKREVSDRLKVRVLINKGTRCAICGINVTGKDIHIDHIKPYSKGGETVLENLQVLCKKHNLAKGNYWEK